MKIPDLQMAAFVEEIKLYAPGMAAMGTPVPDWFWTIPVEDRAQDCNGIGSDDPSVKWVNGPLNALLPWMIVGSVLHDELWCGKHFNDGSHQRFQWSNNAFRNLLHVKAGMCFSREPEFVRVQLQAIRRGEADAAHAVLDQCFEIWAKGANFEPGPEVMG
jgi:hypothetical protein